MLESFGELRATLRVPPSTQLVALSGDRAGQQETGVGIEEQRRV